MTPKHSHFELLCVLAELGTLSPSELMEFREHGESCADCRQRFLEFAQLHATMVVTNMPSRPLHQDSRDITRRFVARAIREGVPLNQRKSTAGLSNLILASATLLVLLIAGTIVGRSRTTPSIAPSQQSDTANSSVYNSAVQAKLSEGAKQTTSNVARNINLHQRTIPVQSRPQDFLRQSSTAQSKLHMHTDWPELSHGQNATSNNAPNHTALSAELNFVQGSLVGSPSKYPRFKFSAPRENTGKEPDLLAACVCSLLAPLDSRTNFALASFAQFVRTDADPYGTTVKPKFRPDPATLQLIENVRQ